MSKRIDAILDEVIKREGSTFTNRAADRGGPTRWGITLATLRSRHWPVSTRSGRGAEARDVARLTETDARTIYRIDYVEAHRFHLLPEPLDAVVVDAGVLSGQRTAGRWLQDSCNDLGEDLRRDGLIGPNTLAAIGRHHPAALAVLVTSHQQVLMGGLIARSARRSCQDDAQAHNAHGWARRLHQRHLDAAREMDKGVAARTAKRLIIEGNLRWLQDQKEAALDDVTARLEPPEHD